MRFRSLGVLLAVCPACVFDADDRCGKDQLFQDGACVCQQGLVMTPDGCAKKTQEAQNSNGSTHTPRSNDDGGANRSVDGAAIQKPGQPCENDDDCARPHDHCRSEPGASVSYCTSQACERDDDCPKGFACQSEIAPSFCKRAPTGAGEPCENDDDCDGFDAWSCNTFQNKCTVINCLDDPAASCFPGYLCCDFSVFDAPSACIPEDELPEGECPF